MKDLYKEQEMLARRMQRYGLNLVNCGDCGCIFLHNVNAEELTCPYCKFTSEPCDFPDFIYEGYAENIVEKQDDN